MAIQIVRKGITKLEVDAIVNAANSQLLAGGGVCGAIFEEAGYKELTDACRKIGHCEIGSAVITPGFSLKAKYSPLGNVCFESYICKSCKRVVSVDISD